MDAYDPHAIERKWQQAWDEAGAFLTPNPDDPAAADARASRTSSRCSRTRRGRCTWATSSSTRSATCSRASARRNGWTVLHPIGFDSFGLPAENAAIREGGHPREIIERNIAHITREMKRMGWSLDWNRVIAAHEPEYYRWTQWLFLKLLEAGLAYRKAAPVKWCPNDQAVLANEQVRDGHCEYCGAEVVSKNLEQWFFKTTAYADELLDELEHIDWFDRIKAMQRNWIGRSEGAEILFRIDELGVDVPVFTTRPDTLFGATFFVLAPEHPLVEQLAERAPDAAELREYVRKAGAKRGEERAAAEEKTGVFTGFTATNPVNDAQIPIWVADYVLMDYGTGAIMAVPAHDERDFAFAQKFELPIVHVVAPPGGEVEEAAAYVAHGEDEVLVNSAPFSGMSAPEGKKAIVDWLGESGRGKPAVSFRLRDWGFSRQRYWGCPIPIVYCDDCGEVPVPEDQLPVVLPEIDDYRPKGIAPLASAEEWVRTPCPRCGKPGRREVETMDTFVDSSWYFLRYCDAHNDDGAVGQGDRRLVVPGRPVHRRRRPRGDAPDLRALFHQGAERPRPRRLPRAVPDPLHQRLGAARRDEDVEVEGQRDRAGRADRDVRRRPGAALHPVHRPGGRGHGVDRRGDRGHAAVRPPPLPARVGGRGARARRGRAGERRCRERRTQTIAKVSDDIGRRQSFNTAISAVMELVNELSRAGADDPAARFAAETAVSLIQPYAPHVAEELWERLGHEPPLGRAVAGRRRVDAAARHGRARAPGERQGARPDPGAGGPVGGRADRARAGVGEGAGASRRPRSRVRSSSRTSSSTS